MACPSINYSMNPSKKERGLGALAPRELAGRLIPSQPSNQLIILCTVVPSLQKKIGEGLLPLKTIIFALKQRLTV